MNIFIPAIALAIYTILFYFYMGLQRRQAVLRRAMDPKYYRLYQDGQEPDELRVRSRHAANLLETPMLFYVVVVMIHVTGGATTMFVSLAWAYVILRFVHAFVHLGSNFVLHRFLVFGLGMIVLLAMWIALLLRLTIY